MSRAENHPEYENSEERRERAVRFVDDYIDEHQEIFDELANE
ncbi:MULTISPECIES: hypothetical protein [Natrialbaceae]|nr:hypothetical protein [Natronococcus sp. CG52]